MIDKQFILASQSPRRRDYLSQLGYQFVCESADIDETVIANEPAIDYVARLSVEKAQCIANQHVDTTIVLGADTCVVVGDEILGKPIDMQDCIRQLSLLSDTTHQVFTAVSVVCGSKVLTRIVRVDVTFKALTEAEIVNYWQTGEPCDKAGAYGIQGIAGHFVKHINGSYSAIVGLPLFETSEILQEFGVLTALQQ